VKLTIVPGFGHNNILRAPQTWAAITELLTLEGAEAQQPPDAAAPSQ
jgi:hypothetical protein